jgi:hypothetical protein
MEKPWMTDSSLDKSEDYIDIYKKNHFQVNDVIFSFEDIPDSKLFLKKFNIITAWNPNNELVNDVVNAENNKQLEQELQYMGLSFDRAVGYLDDHKEESYCVYDISFAQAIELGKMFHQYSIFYNDIKSLGYYEVETSKAILVKSHLCF